jgi:hypothetical protein
MLLVALQALPCCTSLTNNNNNNNNNNNISMPRWAM